MDIEGPGDLAVQQQKYNEDDDKCLLVPVETENEKGEVTAEEQAIFDEHSAILQCHPAVRYAEFQRRLEAIEGQQCAKKVAKKTVQKNNLKNNKSAKTANARRCANYYWMKKAAQYLSEGYEAEEIAERVVLKAGRKKPPTGSQKAKKYKALKKNNEGVIFFQDPLFFSGPLAKGS